MAEGRDHWQRGWVAAVLLLAAVPAAAEKRPGVPSFGIDVEIVSLSLAVTDPHGRPVTDVTAEDMAVFEDGVRQQICVFNQERWPITLAVLIDVSHSMTRVLPIVQGAARRLLRTLGPRDRALVAQFSRHLTILQDFTSDPALLEAAVGSVEIDGDTALYTALYIALKDLQAQRRPGELERQALVVLSDGDDTASMVSDEQILELARQAEVNVYTIGIRDIPQGVPPPGPLPRFFLTALARETGGRAFFPSALSDLDGVYDQIAEELRMLYGVAYTSSNPRPDGEWRTITVRSLRPSLLVRHRAGYYASSARRLARGR